MNNPLVPTPVVDKNGRATTVHKRAATGRANGKAIPQPQLSSSTPSERDKRLFGYLIEDEGQRSLLMDMISTMDGKLVRDIVTLCEDYKWMTAMQTTLKRMPLGPRIKNTGLENRMRYALAAAPVIEKVSVHQPVDRLDAVVHNALANHYRWDRRYPDWTEGTEVTAAGYVMAHSISEHWRYTAPDRTGLDISESDANWMGTNIDSLVPFVPILIERKVCTRADMEVLLESESPALSSGAL